MLQLPMREQKFWPSSFYSIATAETPTSSQKGPVGIANIHDMEGNINNTTLVTAMILGTWASICIN